MASMEHLDLLLGEALECISEAAGELRGLTILRYREGLRHLGNATGELWGVRDILYEIRPDLKRDFVKEHEDDEQRWEQLNSIFSTACVAEDKGEIEESTKLFETLLSKSRFGYFHLLAEAGLYRVSKGSKE